MPIIGVIDSAKTGNLAVGAFDSIATGTPAGSQSYTFNSIPQTYQHLQLSWIVYGSQADSSITIRLNGSTGSYVSFPTYAGSYGSNYALLYYAQDMNLSSSRPAVGVTDFYDYTNTSVSRTSKTIAGSMFFSPGAAMTQFALANNGAISSITVYANTGGNGSGFNGTFGSNTVFALYGIKG
jgi:hypothetical protein